MGSSGVRIAREPLELARYDVFGAEGNTELKYHDMFGVRGLMLLR